MRVLMGLGVAMVLAAPWQARAEVVYSSIPSPMPVNLPSLGYEATSTSELGDAVTLAGTSRIVDSVTVMLSNWALESTYETVGTSRGYSVPLTLTLYNAVGTGLNPTPGSVVATSTIDAFIPWRPEASGDCGGGFVGTDDACHNGLGTTVTFSFANVTVPDTLIFGLSFNTQDYGADPTGTSGPYNSLNFALSTAATVGTDINPDGVEINSSSTNTVAVTGTFGPDSGWSGYVPAVTINAVDAPEPLSLSLLGVGIAGMAIGRRRRT